MCFGARFRRPSSPIKIKTRLATRSQSFQSDSIYRNSSTLNYRLQLHCGTAQWAWTSIEIQMQQQRPVKPLPVTLSPFLIFVFGAAIHHSWHLNMCRLSGRNVRKFDLEFNDRIKLIISMLSHRPFRMGSFILQSAHVSRNVEKQNRRLLPILVLMDVHIDGIRECDWWQRYGSIANSVKIEKTDPLMPT